MKGYVEIRPQYIKDAIEGFEKERAFGRVIRDKGIEAYYQRYYTEGGRFTRWRHKHKTKMGFARAHANCVWGTWADILHSVLTDEECDRLSWWSHNHDYEINPLKALLSQCNGGKILVDDQMASKIVIYRGFNK